MSSFELFSLIIVSLYALGALTILTGAITRSPKLKHVSNLLTITGFSVHTILLGYAMAVNGWALPSGYYMSMLSWSLLLIYFFMWWRFKLSFLSLTASPLALVLFIGSFHVKAAQLPKAWSGAFFGLHIGTLFLSFGLLAMAFGAGILFTRLEAKIKAKEPLNDFEKELPALTTFDKVNQLAVIAGFPLYTVGLITGFIWARIEWGRTLSGDPKEIVSLGVWFIYAWLFHQRLVMGWRGRKAAKAAIWIFGICIFSLIGINIFTSTHHSFLQ
ncbi:MAG: cytochrome c biogenesis protein CcsA [Desulfovibrionales bacterium]|nr:cytochrome c biogenesis protein CcsA [Desulfovibrionales bacterium]